LLHKIKELDLEFLFEFDPQRGLSVDLRRFEPDYYKNTFYPPEEKKKHIGEFVHKVCKVIHKCLKDEGRADLTVTITVRHMISEVSHWKTFYISECFDRGKSQPLSQKETDWHYRFE
jgi:polyribonucleotide nucleotidyltransferase